MDTISCCLLQLCSSAEFKGWTLGLSPCQAVSGRSDNIAADAIRLHYTLEFQEANANTSYKRPEHYWGADLPSFQVNHPWVISFQNKKTGLLSLRSLCLWWRTFPFVKKMIKIYRSLRVLRVPSRHAVFTCRRSAPLCYYQSESLEQAARWPCQAVSTLELDILRMPCYISM